MLKLLVSFLLVSGILVHAQTNATTAAALKAFIDGKLGNDTCYKNHAIQSCGACINDSACVWCDNTQANFGVCMTGGISGPFNRPVCTGDWYWLQDAKGCYLAGNSFGVDYSYILLIVFAIIFVILVGICIGVLCYCCCRKKKKKDKKKKSPRRKSSTSGEPLSHYTYQEPIKPDTTKGEEDKTTHDKVDHRDDDVAVELTETQRSRANTLNSKTHQEKDAKGE